MTWDLFCKLVLFGELAEIAAAIEQDPDLVRAADEHGFTALHILMTEERPAVAELLLRSGADVHSVNDTGHTPLHLVQDRGVLRVLLRHGANLEARGTAGDTPLIVHATEGSDTGSIAIIAALVEAGADINARDNAGESALDHARQREEPDKIALLVTHGANRPTGRFFGMWPSSVDPLACAITLRLGERTLAANLELALDPGDLGVSFVDGEELYFAIFTHGKRLREVVQSHEAIATARHHRLAVWESLDLAQAEQLRWPGAMLHVVEQRNTRDAIPLIDRLLALIPSFGPTIGSTGVYQARQTLLQNKVRLLLDAQDFAAAHTCFTETSLNAPVLEARALAGLQRFDEAIALIDRMPPTREGARFQELWRAAKPAGLAVGAAVAHAKFGRGEIVSLDGTGTKARVKFDDQERALAVSFLKPT